MVLLEDPNVLALERVKSTALEVWVAGAPQLAMVLAGVAAAGLERRMA